MKKFRELQKELKQKWGFDKNITVWGTVTKDKEGRDIWWLNNTVSSLDGEPLSTAGFNTGYHQYKGDVVDGVMIDRTAWQTPVFHSLIGKRVKAVLKLTGDLKILNEKGLIFNAFSLKEENEPDWAERQYEEDHWQKKLEKLKEEVEDCERGIAEVEAKKRDLENANDVLIAEKDSLEKRIQKRQDELKIRDSKLESKIKEKEEYLEVLLKKRALLGFKEEVESEEISKDWEKYPLSVIATTVYDYIRAQNSIYKKSLIEDFTACLATHDIIILAGGSGCGKSSLCRLFAEATGSEFRLIPVKPNWTSSDDLLGFYSSIEQRFIKTKFIQALIDAAKEPHKLFIVCLDEMNLARPEYYFADFLSHLEIRNGERKFSLDVPKFEDVDRQKVSSLLDDGVPIGKSTTSIDEWIADPVALECIKDRLKISNPEEIRRELCRLKLLVEAEKESISSEMTIPDNIRFVGTVNIDETTNFFSPKILDRVHVIRVENPLLDDDFSIEVHHEVVTPIKAAADNFGQLSDYPPINTKLDVCKHLIKLSRRVFIPMNIDISVRVLRQSINYSEKARQVGLTEKEIMDSILEHKVFPQCVFNRDDIGKDNKKLEDLKLLRDENLSGMVGERTIRSVDRLTEQGERSDFINWWN